MHVAYLISSKVCFQSMLNTYHIVQSGLFFVVMNLRYRQIHPVIPKTKLCLYSRMLCAELNNGLFLFVAETKRSLTILAAMVT